MRPICASQKHWLVNQVTEFLCVPECLFVYVCKCVLIHVEAMGQPLLSFPDVIHLVFLKKKKISHWPGIYQQG